MQGIYKITNKINQKVYIGQSQNIEKRWGEHRRNAFNLNTHTYDYPLYRSIRKYGIDSFDFEVIEECSEEELTMKEQKWIEYYDSLNPVKGYNLLNAQDSRKGERCNWAKLSDKQTKSIIEMLKYSQLTFQEIGELYNVSGSCIEDINKGRRRFDEKEEYPIRKNGKSFSHQGEKQNTAKLSTEEVMKIRQRYVTEDIKTIYEDYKDLIAFSGFKKICYGVTWKHLPCYKKREKKWTIEK